MSASLVVKLRWFWIVNYALVLALLLYMAYPSSIDLAGGFVLLATLGYALVFLLPAIWLVWLAKKLFRSERLVQLVAVVVATAVCLLLYADSMLFAMYGFHFNGFVWNLITTPGGVSALGSSQSTYVSGSLIAIGLVLFEVLVFFLLERFVSVSKNASTPKWLKMALVTIVISMIAERAIFGLSHFNSYRPVLSAAQTIPFYRATTFGSFLKRLGYTPVKSHDLAIAGEGRLHYPLNPIQLKDDAVTPNIVILACESLRWDMLTPEIMPNLWAFSLNNRRYTNHLSGGDGTRMGIFSLFYGMPSSYWFAFLNERQPPVLVTTLQKQGYQFGLYTSAKFTYPEFDRTIWATIPAEDLHSDDSRLGWQNDHANVTRLNQFINDSKKNGSPFLGFMFYESSHARYYFPDDAVIRPDYLEDFNYATVDLKANMPAIKARYINSSHALDREIGRVLDNLKQQQLLNDTIIVITGDHGEEFMEKGRWGHNSAFHDEQIHVPMVLHIPGQKAAVIDEPTSHLDLAPTLMPLLGVTNPAADYSVSSDSLLAPQSERFRVVGSWNAIGYISDDYKVSMPTGMGGIGYTSVTTAADEPVADDDKVMKIEQAGLIQMLKDTSHFYRKSRGS